MCLFDARVFFDERVSSSMVRFAPLCAAVLDSTIALIQKENKEKIDRIEFENAERYACVASACVLVCLCVSTLFFLRMMCKCDRAVFDRSSFLFSQRQNDAIRSQAIARRERVVEHADGKARNSASECAKGLACGALCFSFCEARLSDGGDRRTATWRRRLRDCRRSKPSLEISRPTSS